MKKKVELTYDGIFPLTTITCFISKKVHLAWQSFAVNSKYAVFPGSHEVNRARLHRVRGKVYLLSIVKTIMDPNAPGVRWYVRCKWRRLEGVSLSEELLHIASAQCWGNWVIVISCNHYYSHSNCNCNCN